MRYIKWSILKKNFRGSPSPFQPYNNLTAQADPWITLHRGRGWGESNIKGNGKGTIENKNIYTGGVWEESVYAGVDEAVANQIMTMSFF